MSVSKTNRAPKGGDGRWPLCGEGGFGSARWGDLEIGYTGVEEPVNVSPVYEGLPGRVSPRPHHGYVFSGRLRCVYADSDYPDEVASTGDVYFFRLGTTSCTTSRARSSSSIPLPHSRSSWTTSSV